MFHCFCTGLRTIYFKEIGNENNTGIFTFDKNYVLAAKVAIHSMLVHASKDYKYELYILHTSLDDNDYRNIRSVTEDFNAGIHFINVSEYEKKIEGLHGKAHYSKEIFYKLIAADIFRNMTEFYVLM